MFSSPPDKIQAQRLCYLAAVSLNNSAVSLLERARSHQALKVLENAVVAIREVMIAKPDGRSLHLGPEDVPAYVSLQEWMESSWFPHWGGLDLDDMLHKASRYRMDSGPAALDDSTVESQLLDVEMPQLRTGSEIFPPVEATALIRLDAPHCRAFNAAGDDSVDPTRVALPHLEVITILHNYAAAVRMHPISDQALRRGAVRVAHLAFCHVCCLFRPKPSSATSYGGDGASCSPFEDVALLQLSLLLARCSYQLYVELGDMWGAGQSLSQYRLVLLAMESEEVRHAHRLVGLSVPHAKVA